MHKIPAYIEMPQILLQHSLSYASTIFRCHGGRESVCTSAPGICEHIQPKRQVGSSQTSTAVYMKWIKM